MQHIQLLHPIHRCPATADVTGYWHDNNARNVGLKLLFPCGHQTALTYEEIRDLQPEQVEEVLIDAI